MTKSLATLAGAFDAATFDDWRALANAGPADGGLDALVSKTASGIDLQPIYERLTAPAAQPGMAHAGAWDIVQRIDLPDPEDANAQIHDDLAGGATGLELIFSASPNARGAGIALEDISGMARLLDRVDLEAVPLRLCAGHECRHVTALLIGHAVNRGIDMSKLRLRLGFDAVSDLALYGFMNFSLERAYTRAMDLDQGLRDIGLDVQFPTLDGRPWHAAGATEPQELAAIVSSALHHVRGLVAAGAGLITACGKASFTVAADADQFMTMAKLRALRRIWARIQQEMGIALTPVHIHAETAWRMMSKRDPHMNVLRGTMAVFAAAAGGADSISVLPFTAAHGLPDGFARRIARNTQTILAEESNLHRVADPAAGSGAFEALTDELARAAWSLFQSIEADGGLHENLRKGGMQAMVANARKARMDNVRRLEEPLIGVSAYPNLKELPVDVLPATPPEMQSTNMRMKLPEPGAGNLFTALIEAARSGVTLADMSLARVPQPQRLPASIPPMRLSEPFEALRDASDGVLEQRGARPHAFIAGGGGKPADAARTAWLKSVLATGGIVASGTPHEGPDSGLAAALGKTGAAIACLCPAADASDDAIAASAAALAGAGVATIIAVRGEDAPALAADNIIAAYPGCDVIGMMGQALARAGIQPPDELVMLEKGAQA